jgi:hypothetical protein
MDLLEVLGLSPPADDNAVCFEVYKCPCAFGEHLQAADCCRRMMQQPALMHFHDVAMVRQLTQPFVLPGASEPEQHASESELNSVRDQCMQLIHSHLEGYIWQHDAFELHSSLQQLPPWQSKHKGVQRGVTYCVTFICQM